MSSQDTTAAMKELGRQLAAVDARELSIKEKAQLELNALAAERDELHRALGKLAVEAAQGEPAGPRVRVALPASAKAPLPAGTRGQGQRLVELLKEKPGSTQTWLAEKLYGDPAATPRLSSLLDYLRKTNRARPRGDGTWEAVP